jgi:hypothetical protein
VNSTRAAEPNPIVPSSRFTVLPPDVTTSCPDATSVHDHLDEILRRIHDVRDSELYLLAMQRLAV